LNCVVVISYSGVVIPLAVIGMGLWDRRFWTNDERTYWFSTRSFVWYIRKSFRWDFESWFAFAF